MWKLAAMLTNQILRFWVLSWTLPDSVRNGESGWIDDTLLLGFRFLPASLKPGGGGGRLGVLWDWVRPTMAIKARRINFIIFFCFVLQWVLLDVDQFWTDFAKHIADYLFQFCVKSRFEFRMQNPCRLMFCVKSRFELRMQNPCRDFIPDVQASSLQST